MPASFNRRMAAGLNRPAGTLDVRDALKPYRGIWNERLAAHLLRRAGFGGTPYEVARFARMSQPQAVRELLHFSDTSGLPAPPDVYDPFAEDWHLGQLRGLSADQRRKFFNTIRKRSRISIVSMQRWWLNRMLVTPNPLQEKMTFLFHGHFTTAAMQKGVWPIYVWNQQQLFRSHALGNLRDLTIEVSKDPAMLLYLDNALNNKSHPNENYARELMELFTLGHGNYTEEDVRQSARAFTGWTLNRFTGSFVDNRRIHDTGLKTFLHRTGNFDGTDIVSIIYDQPACARWWASTLLNNFVYNDPEPQLIDALAAVIRQNDYNLAPVLSTVFASNVFYSDRAYRALVKSPVEYLVGTHKALALPQIVERAPVALRQMGQVLFSPPNVAGWPGGANWITSQMTISRQNFLASLVNSPMMDKSAWVDRTPMDPKPAVEMLVGQLLQGDAPSVAQTQILRYLDGSDTSALKMLNGENFQERVRGAAYLTMSLPAYQLA